MKRGLVVVGASAGGIEALRRVLRDLPADFPAAVLIALHVGSSGPSALARILARVSALPVRVATDGAPVEPGVVLVAPPDRHLLLWGASARLGAGPRENGHRPAVDPLFRTAARWWGARAIGAVLSGCLDDGTAGMVALRMRGAATVVQDPDEADFAGMPRSALTAVPDCHVATTATMAATLIALVEEDLPEVAIETPPTERGLPEDEAPDESVVDDARDDREGRPSGPPLEMCVT